MSEGNEEPIPPAKEPANGEKASNSSKRKSESTSGKSRTAKAGAKGAQKQETIALDSTAFEQKRPAPKTELTKRTESKSPFFSLTALVILFLISLILVLTEGMYGYWPITYLGWVGIVFFPLYALSFYTGEAARHSFESTTALVSAMALAAAVYWFFYERPGVPKLELTPTAEVWPIKGKRVILRIVVRVENVGSTVLKFEDYKHKTDENGKTLFDAKGKPVRDDRMEVNVGQLKPMVESDQVTAELLEEYDKRFFEGKATFRIIDRNDLRNNFWPMKGRKKMLPVGEIESGEAQEYFYSGIFDCQDGIVFVVNAKIPKKYDSVARFQNANDQTLFWMGETVSQDGVKCTN